MAKRIAKEWLWMIGESFAAIGQSLMYRDPVRTTIWAVRTARKTSRLSRYSI
jgi:hypothetical protein